ncbi:tyrosine-type recombinase/integrase [Dyadobacter koreensis]|uniref:tyrosine-type recombinase/integrase n=1 Tax=Dyadobacter koreensis TaxID=408657 RepID=UPI000B8749FC|nr:tyrosine-type recombinase/integrase [Dyadobacter koreensis]
MYLFSYYNAGIRIKDLLQLRNLNIKSGRLEYEMDKTGHIKSIPLNKKALKILAIYYDKEADPKHYFFPVLDNDTEFAEYITYQEKKKMSFELRKKLFNAISSHTAQVNNNLKIISDKIELESPITFHTSRHSFAEKAWKIR